MREVALPLSEITVNAVQGTVLAAIGKHGDHTVLNPRITDEEKLAVLVEEVGEVARALTYDQPRENLCRELLHVAATAAGWAQCVDDENGV